MQTSPIVSVVMPVYNTDQYLRDAVDSILNQTLVDLELIMIDDGSTDGSGEILDHYARSDDRVLVIHQDNQGIARTLNTGLNLARGKYIARMDGDDISLPDRLVVQTAFMDRRPEVGICGTACRLFGDTSGLSWTTTDPDEIKSRLLFWPCMSHPTVMMRRDLVVRERLYYDADFEQAEDYELWLRFSRCCRIANVPDVLLLYRTRRSQATSAFDEDVRRWSLIVQKRAIADLGIEPSDDELDVHRSLFTSSFEVSRDYVRRVETWLCKLLDANLRSQVCEPAAHARVLFERWSAVCASQSELGLWAWKTFRNSKLFAAGRQSSRASSLPLVWRFVRARISTRLDSSAAGRLIKSALRNSAALGVGRRHVAG